MIQVFIILSLSVIGKIHGQEVIIPHINVQFLPPPIPLNGRTQLILAPPQNWQFEAIRAEPLENPTQRAALSSTQTIGFNLQSTVSEDTLEHYYQTQKPESMNPPTTDVLHTSTHSVGNKSRSDNDNDRLNLEENIPKPVPNSEPPSEVTSMNQKASTTPAPMAAVNERLTLPPIRNVTVVNPATNETVFQPIDKNGTKVTFDDRANFEGDKCPTGYVKVNGKCVEAD